MAFRVGQKVVQVGPWSCKDTGYADVVFTTAGQVYTVREILVVRGLECIRVNEVVNPPHKYAGFPELIEQPFPAWNFRPIVERKTDISIFTAMLTDKRQVVSQGETARD